MTNPQGLQTIFPFAPAGANYPAGANPWSATATNDAPGYGYFTPGVPPAAQEMNYLMGGNKSDAQNLQNVIGHMLANAWTPPFTVAAGTHAAASNSNPISPFWSVAVIAVGGGSVQAYTSRINDSAGWLAFGSAITLSSVSVASVLQLQTGTMWLSIFDSSNNMKLYSGSGGAYSLIRTDANSYENSPLGVTDPTIGTPLFVYANAKTTGASLLQVSADNGATWSVIEDTDAAPTGWFMADNAGNSGVSVGAYAFIVMPQAESDTYYVYGGGGVTDWHPLNMVAGGINGGSIPSAMCFGYGLNGPCWYLACQLPATGGLIYQSYDSVNWTLLATIPTLYVQTMSAIGNTLMVTLLNPPSSFDGIVYYANMVVNPKVFYASGLVLRSTGAPKLYSSYGQTLVIRDGECRFGMTYGSASAIVAS